MDMTITYVHSSPAVFKFMEKGKLHIVVFRSTILPNLIMEILFRSAVKAAGL